MSDADGLKPPENSDQGDRWTVGRLLTWTTDYLKRRGSESPRLDAEVLLAHVLDWTRVKLYTHYEDLVDEAPRASYRELIRRRAEGTPVAYLVGHKEFYSLTFKVSPAVLIPRPDSEFVVVEFLSRLKGVAAPRCVDVGTGSGCLAIACAHQHKTATFTAIDISPEALAMAIKNTEIHQLGKRVRCLEGDLLEPVSNDEPFDVILSNPPYIAEAVIPDLEPGVRDYEPHLALNGGNDGLRVVTRLIEQSLGRLKKGGHLLLEIGTDQEEGVRSLIEQRPELQLAPTIRDHANHPRVIAATFVG